MVGSTIDADTLTRHAKIGRIAQASGYSQPQQSPFLEATVNEDLSNEPHFLRLSRELSSGLVFSGASIAPILSDGTAKSWGQRLAHYHEAGLLQLVRGGLSAGDEHVSYRFANKLHGRGAESVPMPLRAHKSSVTESADADITVVNLQMLVGAVSEKEFTLARAIEVVSDKGLALAAIALARKHSALRIDKPPRAKGSTIPGEFAFDLDRLPKECGGRFQKSEVSVVRAPTVSQGLSPGTAQAAHEALVSAFYGASSFTLERVKRVPWFAANTGHGKPNTAADVIDALVRDAHLEDLTHATVDKKSDKRELRLVAHDRTADRIAMRLGKIWGEERCISAVEEVSEDLTLRDALTTALRTIPSDESGWFEVTASVAGVLRTALNWSQHRQHQLFVERFLEQFAATPAGSLLEVRPERSPSDGEIRTLHCRCASTGGTTEVSMATGSQTSKADNLTQAQIDACRAVYTDVVKEFYGRSGFKVQEIEDASWFKAGLFLHVSAPEFASLLIKDGLADVTSTSYAEGSNQRRLRFNDASRWYAFLAMETDQNAGASHAAVIIGRLRKEGVALDQLEEVLVRATENAKDRDYFALSTGHIDEVRAVLGWDGSEDFVEYFLRKLVDEEGLLDLDRYYVPGEREGIDSEAPSLFRCVRRERVPEDDVQDEEPPVTPSYYVISEESIQAELVQVRADYEKEETELRYRIEEQQIRAQRIQELEQCLHRQREVARIFKAALDQIATVAPDETQRRLLQEEVAARLTAHAQSAPAQKA